MRSVLPLLMVYSLCCLHSWPVPVSGQALLRALSRQAESGVTSALRGQLSQMQANLPPGVVCPSCLMLPARAQSQLLQGSVDRSQLRASLASRGLPREVADKLESLAFARSVVFHTFSFVVNSLIGRGHYETFVGAGRRLNGATVEFGVIRSTANAQLVAKTTSVPRRSCKRRFFIKRCRSWTEQVPRGLTAEELSRVETALRHFAVASAVQRMGASVIRRGRRLADLGYGEDNEEDTSQGITETSEKIVKISDTTVEISGIDAKISEETSATGTETDPGSPKTQEAAGNCTATSEERNITLTELIRRGFDQLMVSSSTQTLRGIPVSRAVAFAAVFARSLQLPVDLVGPLRDAVADAVVAADGKADDEAEETKGRWRRRVSLLFSTEDRPAAVRFVRLALRRRGDAFDLAAGSVQLSIQFAGRLQLLASGGSEEEGQEDRVRVRRLPACISQDDLRRALRLLSNRFSRNLPLLGRAPF